MYGDRNSRRILQRWLRMSAGGGEQGVGRGLIFIDFPLVLLHFKPQISE